MKKAIVIIAIIVSVFLLSGCEKDRAKLWDKTEFTLAGVSEGLESIIDDCEYAIRHGDYDSMEEELGMTIVRCEEMKQSIDDLRDKFR